jgi:hypothetical protein
MQSRLTACRQSDLGDFLLLPKLPVVSMSVFSTYPVQADKDAKMHCSMRRDCHQCRTAGPFISSNDAVFSADCRCIPRTL